MKPTIIVANWKANKTIEEAKKWLKEVKGLKLKTQSLPEVILCAPFVHLAPLKDQLLTLSPTPYTLTPKLGAQDISPFEDGPYTGEVTGRMLEGLVNYVIIGHSERRKYFGESEEILKKKVERAVAAGLKPIYCVLEVEMPIPEGVEVVAYEPLFAIGSGKPDTPENADQVAEKIKEKYQVKVLYGGSIQPSNVRGFVSMSSLDGVLVGGASLLAQDFLEIIQNAT